MNKEKIYKIEYDILEEFENRYPVLKNKILPLVEKVDAIEREFTGVGAFITFKFKDKDIKKNKLLKNKILNEIYIQSNEFEHEVPVLIKFNSDGILDYIELAMGMTKKNYPKRYKIIAKSPKYIID